MTYFVLVCICAAVMRILPYSGKLSWGPIFADKMLSAKIRSEK
jgi:hypothetical protein